MTLAQGGFYLMALVTLVGALGTVTLRDLTRALLSAVVFFFGVAALFFSLHADMLGAVQILIYVGAVAVMTVYAIVLTRAADNGIEQKKSLPIAAATVAGAMIALLLTALWLTPALNAKVPAAQTASFVDSLALTMLGTYVLPFELASLLLTAAMIGAVVIALDEVRPQNAPPSQPKGRP